MVTTSSHDVRGPSGTRSHPGDTGSLNLSSEYRLIYRILSTLTSTRLWVLEILINSLNSEFLIFCFSFQCHNKCWGSLEETVILRCETGPSGSRDPRVWCNTEVGTGSYHSRKIPDVFPCIWVVFYFIYWLKSWVLECVGGKGVIRDPDSPNLSKVKTGTQSVFVE